MKKIDEILNGVSCMAIAGHVRPDGDCIGSLERFIITCMLLLGQYSAVALVFTAKSIVRFKDFEDRSFAEYYLYGTLLSVAVSIALFALLKIFGA